MTTFRNPLWTQSELDEFDRRQFLSRLLSGSGEVTVFSLLHAMYWQNLIEYAFACPLSPNSRQWLFYFELDFDLPRDLAAEDSDEYTDDCDRVIWTDDQDVLPLELLDLLQDLFQCSQKTARAVDDTAA